MASINLVWPLLFQASLAIVIVFGFIGFLMGIGLTVSGAKTLRFFHAMNRWVSARRAIEPLERPREDIDQFAHKYRRWVGIPLLAGGAFSTFGLVARVDASEIGAIFATGTSVPVLVMAAETLRWFLIVGSVAGAVIGILLCYSPGVLSGFEKYANRWISDRWLVRGEDQMHLTLDKLVEAHPRQSGWIATSIGRGVSVYAALLLFARH